MGGRCRAGRAWLAVTAGAWLWAAAAACGAGAGEAVPAEAAGGGAITATVDRIDTLFSWLDTSFGAHEIAGYSVWRLLIAAFIIAVALAVHTLIAVGLKRRLEAELVGGEAKRPVVAIFLRSLRAPLRLVVWAMTVFLALPVLAPGLAERAAWLLTLLFNIGMAMFVYNMVEAAEYFLSRHAAKTDTRLDDMLIPVVRKTLRILVVVVAGLHIYQRLSDQPITALLAGLGVGGLAVALAAQESLKNFFGFVTILLDRPFLLGERVVIDGHDGAVEAVGLRSVKIRRLDGHQVTVPNAKAADETIHNIGRRPYIRRLINITITYDTPPDKVERAVAIVRELLADHEGMNPEFPPRVFFNEFNADSLNILAIYWYHPPDYWRFLEYSQRLNLEIMRRYEAEGIEFAFPTQTLYLAGDPNRRLVVALREEDSGRGPPAQKGL